MMRWSFLLLLVACHTDTPPATPKQPSDARVFQLGELVGQFV